MSEISWYMKYQPKKLEDYIFYNESNKDIVESWISTEEINGNVLLYGPPGFGKTALTELIIKNIIKHSYDLKVIKSRSVNQIDELFEWCQIVPLKSKKKLVYIEEFDKLSKVALTTMKDSLLEKFQEYVSFICNTNFVNKIEPAIKSRFNYAFNINVTESSIKDIFKKLEGILIDENITYNTEVLQEFVNNYYRKGLRNLITSIQIGSTSGILNLSNIENSLEDDVIEFTDLLLKDVFKCNNSDQKKQIILNPLSSPVGTNYSKIVEIIYYNNDLNWDYIFTNLEYKFTFIPLKILIGEYIETIEQKKLPYVHYISFLYKAMKSIMEIS